MKIYSRLPTYMYHEDVRRCILEFLFDYQKEEFRTAEQLEHALEQLLEISKRNNYRYLDKAVLTRLSNFILNCLSNNENCNTDIVIEIVLNTGLFSIWNEVILKMHTNKSPFESRLFEKLEMKRDEVQLLFFVNSWYSKKLFTLQNDANVVTAFEIATLSGCAVDQLYNSHEIIVCECPGSVRAKRGSYYDRPKKGHLFITAKRLLWLPRYKSKIGLIQEGFDVEFTQIKTFAIQKRGPLRSSMSLFLSNDDCLEIFPRYSKTFNTELSERLLNNHRYLPDGLTIEQTRQYFIEFLFDHQDVKLGEELSTFEQMCEIAKRETYDVLDKALLAKIAEFVLKHLDYEDFELMDVATTIIVRQGITEAWQAVLEKKDVICNLEVVKLINEINEECGDHIDDPYWSYKQLDKSD